MTDNNQRDIEQWMKDVANKHTQKKKLVFDRKKKKLVPVSLDDPRIGADEVIEFIPDESRRF